MAIRRLRSWTGSEVIQRANCLGVPHAQPSNDWLPDGFTVHSTSPDRLLPCFPTSTASVRRLLFFALAMLSRAILSYSINFTQVVVSHCLFALWSSARWTASTCTRTCIGRDGSILDGAGVNIPYAVSATNQMKAHHYVVYVILACRPTFYPKSTSLIGPGDEVTGHNSLESTSATTSLRRRIDT